MATFTDAKSLAAHQRRRAAKVRRSLFVEHKAVVEAMQEEARRLTSGTVSSETLRAMGHPFARKATKGRRKGAQRGSLPRLPINRQTGDLQKSLRVFRRWQGNTVAYQLQFTSPHSVVLTPGGTDRMVARGFWSAMKQHYQRTAFRRLQRAFRRGHK
jgi:hypothetical protein